MHEDVDDVIAMRGAMIAQGFQRMVSISFALHLGIVVLLVTVPREWFATPEKRLMTISLSGTPGERTTGINPVSGKQVDQVAEQPRRPEPAKPVEALKPDTMKVPEKPAPKPQPTKPVEAKPEPARPVVTGKEVSKGTAQAVTGATSPGTGLTTGGGIGGSVSNLEIADFCCPEFLAAMSRQITRDWRSDQPHRGEAVVQFTILRDGTIVDKILEKSSGFTLLDVAALSAVPNKLLVPLPDRYPGPKLTVHLRFPYEK